MSYHKNFDENLNGFLSRNSKLIVIFIQNDKNLKKSHNTLKTWEREFSIPNVKTYEKSPTLKIASYWHRKSNGSM